MNLKVRNDDLNQIINKLDDDTIQISKYLEYLLYQINELKNVWQGEDAEEFYYKAELYINYLKSVPTIYKDLSIVMKNANDTYKKLDHEYAQLMKKVVVKHE